MKWYAVQDKDGCARGILFADPDGAEYERSACARMFPEDAPFRIVTLVRLEDAIDVVRNKVCRRGSMTRCAACIAALEALGKGGE